MIRLLPIPASASWSFPWFICVCCKSIWYLTDVFQLCFRQWSINALNRVWLDLSKVLAQRKWRLTVSKSYLCIIIMLRSLPREGICTLLGLRASPVAQLVENPPAMWVQALGWKDPLEKGKATHSGEFHGLYSMDCIVHGVVKSQTRLSDFHFHFQAVRGLPRWR